MRLGSLSAAAAVACLWLAGRVGAEGAVGSTADQPRTAGDEDVVPPRQEGETPRVSLPAGSDSSCGPSGLYNRTIDPSRYRFGCPEIEVSHEAMPTEHRSCVCHSGVVAILDLGGV